MKATNIYQKLKTAGVINSPLHNNEDEKPIIENNENKHELSEEVVQNYKDVGVSEDILNELNTIATDTVTVGDRNFRHFNRQMAALDLAKTNKGVVSLYKSPGETIETTTNKRGKEEIVPFFGDKIYTKDDKEKLAATVTPVAKFKKTDSAGAYSNATTVNPSALKANPITKKAKQY